MNRRGFLKNFGIVTAGAAASALPAAAAPPTPTEPDEIVLETKSPLYEDVFWQGPGQGYQRRGVNAKRLSEVVKVTKKPRKR